jgi:hypothetical protein
MHRGGGTLPHRISWPWLRNTNVRSDRVGSGVAARVVPGRKTEAGAGSTHRRAAARWQRLGSREEAAA